MAASHQTDLYPDFLRAVRAMDALRPGISVVLGVSGGADSLAMLHLFRRAADDLQLRLHVLHVHHGIRGEEADSDAAFVKALCREWKIPCKVVKRNVPAMAKRYKLSIEEAARQARYTALGKEAIRLGADVIAVAHNADDQAETVLMHLLRGSGLAGLRGMLAVTPLADYHLADGAVVADKDLPDSPLPAGEGLGVRVIRPLLAIPRARIDAYCAAHGLTPRIDRTNMDTTLFRNRLRHEVMPLLDGLIPGVRERLGRTASVLAADYEVLEADVIATLEAIVIRGKGDSARLSLGDWRGLPLAIQRATIRRAVWYLRPHLRDVSFQHVEAAVQVAQTGETGAQATLPAGLILRVDYDELIVQDENADIPDPAWPFLPSGSAIPANVPGETELPGDWRFCIDRYDGPRSGREWKGILRDAWSALLNDRVGAVREPPLQLRTRRPGDCFQPQGVGGSQKVSEFMINAKIPASLRDRIPLLVAGDEIAWLCGWRVDERFVVREDTKEVWLARFERVDKTKPAP